MFRHYGALFRLCIRRSIKMEGLLGLFLVALDIVAIINLLKSDAEKIKKVLWAVVIVAFPIGGLIIWYLMGPKSDWSPLPKKPSTSA